MKNKKICFICSSGGHYSELKMLKELVSDDSFLITEKTENFKSDFTNKYYLINEINRKEKGFIFKFIFLSFKELGILIKENPKYIISTGALCAYPICLIGKIFGKKIIYIESFARIIDLSLTGKKLYKLADKFYVQWEELTLKYPKAIFVGNLFGKEFLK